MRKYLFIVNPKSGKGRGRKILPKLKSLMAKSSQKTEIIETRSKGDCERLIPREHNNFTHIIIVGGDGTLNEAINGIDLNSQVVLGTIPIGSGNDFARTVNFLKSNFENNVISMLNFPNERQIDIGIVKFFSNGDNNYKERRFINTLGIGFDSIVARLIQENNYLTGLPLYLTAVVKALRLYKNIELEVIKDGNILYNRKSLFITIGNGAYSGGGFMLNPKSVIDDGLLNACIVDAMNPLKIIIKLPKAINGNHIYEKEVKLLLFNDLTINIKNPAIIHLDGEVVSSKIFKVQIKTINKALNFLTN